MLRFRTAVKLTFALLAVWLGLVWAGLAPRPAFLPPNLDIEPLTYLLGALAAMLFIFWKNPVPANTENTSIPPEKEIIEKLRIYLRERYERRKKNKLAGGIEMFLRMVPTAVGTSPDIAKHHTHLPEDEITQPVEYFFDKSGGRLLVIGLPGTGKTYQLLELALSLLGPKNPEHEDYKKKQSNIPVLLNLATWRTEFETLDGWLKRILPLELGASCALAERILHSEHLILLLDGLDEVPEADRASCLKAIGMYGKVMTRRFAITSRRDEYVTTAEDAFVKLEVEMQLLSPEKIQQNLAAWEAKNLSVGLFKDALQTDPLLREAISNPFYLNTAQLLFATGRKYSDFGFTVANVAGRQRELVERFVEDALGRKIKRDYPKVRARKWLGFLAGKMEEEGKIKFELVDVKPWWVRIKWWYKTLIHLAFIIIVGHLLYVLVWVYYNHIQELPIESEIILTLEWILYLYILFNETEDSTIKTSDQLKWSWEKFTNGLIPDITKLGCLVIISFVFLSFFINWGWDTLAMIVVVILFLGLIQGIFENFFLRGIVIESYLKIQSPYQRFIGSLRALNFSLLRHLNLRLKISLLGYLPLRLVTFLNEMSLRHLLEFDGDPETGKGGGAWRWRHRIIQEYFLRDMNE